MKRLRSRKFCAALVIIAWVATLAAFWGMQDAARRAIAPPQTAPAPLKAACTSTDLEGLGIQLEMASSAEDAKNLLTGEPVRADCIRRGMAAQVRADYLFIPAYSGLVLALFLFVRSFWITPPRERKPWASALLILGVVLAAAMMTGDVIENLHLTSMIDLAARNHSLPNDAFDRLVLVGRLKWGALAASAFLLALAWASDSWQRLAWVLRLLGFAAAALFIAGLATTQSELVKAGLPVLFGFWLTALIHAIAVAVETKSGGTT